MLCLKGKFQSTHPYRVWRNILNLNRQTFLSFNPHTHTGCDNYATPKISFISCFNPHTHTGCDCLASWQIHILIEFQSTHPYRVWQPAGIHVNVNEGFNPHTHTGCDIIAIAPATANISFNPHTHTGCDWCIFRFPLYALGFNPHTHTGCDYPALADTPEECEFQSTHPYRVWPHIQQKAEYHDAKIDILRKTTK